MDGLPTFGDSIGLWDTLNDNGKIKVKYGICVDDFAITIYGAFRKEVCIVVQPKVVFGSFL
jgi:DNA gyrase inhibitor GyrI